MSRNNRSTIFEKGARGKNASDPRGVDRAREVDLFEELEAVYRDADEAFAGWSCSTSTECCRFGITGREPYVTSIELAYLRRAVMAGGGSRAITAKRSLSLPLVGDHLGVRRDERGYPPNPPSRSSTDERTCPMLINEGRCAVYAARPLGCRTFYCERAVPFAPVKHSAITALVRRIKDIASRHAPEGDLGRPLTRALSP